MPEMSANTKDSWKAFQKRARTNMGGLVCSSLGGRIIPNGVRVGDGKNLEAVAAARKIWRDNRLDIVFGDAIWNMLSVSVGYLVTGVRDGEPIITSEQPEQMITVPDPVQPWRARAGLKAWRDEDAKKDYALVWVAGRRQRFVRGSATSSGTIRSTTSGDWETDGLEEAYAGPVPIFVLDNHNNVAEFEPHIDVIDRINVGKLQRMVTAALQAFRQKAIKGGLPEQDEQGNVIDWSKRLVSGPGTLWDLPEGLDVWEAAVTDITPLLEGEKGDARDLSAVTQTPLDVFLPSGENQSATGAANSQKGEIQKAKDRISRAKSPGAAAMVSALRALGLDDGSTVEILFEPPEHISFNEKTTAAVAAKDAGMSRLWISQNIMGMSPDEIAENEANLAVEQLSQLTLTSIA